MASGTSGHINGGDPPSPPYLSLSASRLQHPTLSPSFITGGENNPAPAQQVHEGTGDVTGAQTHLIGGKRPTQRSPSSPSTTRDPYSLGFAPSPRWGNPEVPGRLPWHDRHVALGNLPNELLYHILGFLDVNDLLATSRTSHHLRELSVAPILHRLRLRRAREALSPLLSSPSRPSLAGLIARSIFLTKNTVVSRKLGRALTAIRLSRRLAARPSPEALVERCVLPAECAPGIGHVAPALVAKKRAIEKERVKDDLRKWVGAVWRGEVKERSEGVRRWEERSGVGRVWRLRRFFERLSEAHPA